MRSQRILAFSLFFSILSVSLSGCCTSQNKFNNPEKPNPERNWNGFVVNDEMRSLPNIVLHKGESINNGKVGIEVVELYPAKCGLFVHDWEKVPRAKMRFFKLSTREEIYAGQFERGRSTLTAFAHFPEGFPWPVLEIKEVHARDGWGVFDLRK